MISSVPTHLINNAFTHKLHFPPLVILPLVPAAKKRTNEYISLKPVQVLLLLNSESSKSMFSRTWHRRLVLPRLAFDTRFPAYNAPCSRADLGGAGKGRRGQFSGAWKVFLAFKLFMIFWVSNGVCKKCFIFQDLHSRKYLLVVFFPHGSYYTIFFFQQNKGVSLTADFMFPWVLIVAKVINTIIIFFWS